MSERREVHVYFGKDHKLSLATDDPEALIEQITSSDSGWFRHKDVVIKRADIKYAGIANTKPTPQAKAVRGF